MPGWAFGSILERFSRLPSVLLDRRALAERLERHLRRNTNGAESRASNSAKGHKFVRSWHNNTN